MLNTNHADDGPHNKTSSVPNNPSGKLALLSLAMIRAHYVPLAQRTLFRMIATGAFPPADIRIGGKVRLWRAAEGK